MDGVSIHNMSGNESVLPASRKALDSIQENSSLFVLWIVFRIITSMTAVVASNIRPITEIEKSIAIWPPTTPVNHWLERVFISPWYRWDVEWYSRIISNGYSNIDGTATFHPLFPLLGRMLTTLHFDEVFSLLIISSTATLLLLVILKKLLALNLSNSQVNLALLIFLVFPASFILFAPYPESLFLLFSVICFYSLRMKRWGYAGTSASLAVLTRQQGLFLIIPYLWELWEASDRNIKGLVSQWKRWITILFIPLAYLGWIGYRYLFLGESIIKINSIQEVIYSIFISSNATSVVPNQNFIWPWSNLHQGYQKITSSPDIDIWINTIAGILFIWIIIVAWKKMSPGYRLYSIAIYIVSFSYFTGPIHPFMGLPRHLYLAFPIFAGITPLFDNKKIIRWLYISISIIFMSILITAYVLKAWVP